jgi:hypothetical protein
MSTIQYTKPPRIWFPGTNFPCLAECGAFYIMDRGYIDFARLHALHQSQAFFVVRARDNMQFRRLYSHSVDHTTGLRCDQTIVLT